MTGQSLQIERLACKVSLDQIVIGGGDVAGLAENDLLNEGLRRAVARVDNRKLRLVTGVDIVC